MRDVTAALKDLTDRLRALDLLSEMTADEEQRESALKKLDEVLSRLTLPPEE